MYVLFLAKATEKDETQIYIQYTSTECGRNNSRICRRRCSGASGAGWAGLVSVSSTFLTISIAVMAWSGKYRSD
jgi:hypothetical protein